MATRTPAVARTARRRSCAEGPFVSTMSPPYTAGQRAITTINRPPRGLGQIALDGPSRSGTPVQARYADRPRGDQGASSRTSRPRAAWDRDRLSSRGFFLIGQHEPSVLVATTSRASSNAALSRKPASPRQMRPCRRELARFVGGERVGIDRRRLADAPEPKARGAKVAETEVGEAAVKGVARGAGNTALRGVDFDRVELVHRFGVAAVIIGAHGPAERRRAALSDERESPEKPTPSGAAPRRRAGQKRTIVHSLASDKRGPSFVGRGRIVPW